jgi:hypothetical protein
MILTPSDVTARTRPFLLSRLAATLVRWAADVFFAMATELVVLRSK